MKASMPYRYLGKSGLKVSVLGFGNWANSASNTPQTNQQFFQIMEQCYTNGVNFYDTAEYYGYGIGEKQYGDAFQHFKWPRSSIVVTSKYMWGGAEINNSGTSRKHIIEANALSLERMNLDYLDIVFAHRYDVNTPIEETCKAFNYLIENGKAFYWGTSKWKPFQIMKAMECCERFDLIKPIVEQPEYSLCLRKGVEVELLPFYQEYGLGLTVWSPLAGGLLTGKYLISVSEDSRYAAKNYDKTLINHFLGRYGDCNSKVAEFVSYCKELGKPPAEVALGWVMSNMNVSSCIMGSTNVEQVKCNLRSVELLSVWKSEMTTKLNSIFKI